jgi:hypothetical protein
VVIPDASNLRNAEHRELFLSRLQLAISEDRWIKTLAADSVTLEQRDR